MYSYKNGKVDVKNNVKNVFISQPMRGFTEKAILNKRKEATDKIIKIVNEVYGKTKVNIIDSYLVDTPPNTVNAAVYYLGRAIQQLSEADIIFVCNGYKKARGCLIEEQVAKLYNIPIIYEESVDL